MDMSSEAPGTVSQEYGTRDYLQSSDACIISLGGSFGSGAHSSGLVH